MSQVDLLFQMVVYFKESISAFLEYHLKPLLQKHKSFLKNTNDFLKNFFEMDLEISRMTLYVCTIGVVELYPNIPNKEGLEAIRKPSNRFDGQFDSFGRVCFKNNVFEHNTRHFKQLQRRAIGTKFASPYAILFMD